MARMIMSASSSELHPAHKRPSPYGSQCGVLKRLKVVRDEDEDETEEEREEQPDLYKDEMEARTSHINIKPLSSSEHVFTPYLPSTAAHTIRGFTHRYHTDEKEALAAENLLARSETARPDTDQPDPKSQPLSPDIHTPLPIPSSTPSSSSSSSSSSTPTPLSTHRLILRARTHLHSARVKISRHPRSGYIEIPDASWMGVRNKRKRGDERIVEERECPKRVLMEGMFPGVGIGGLEGLREGGGFDDGGGGLGRGKRVGRREGEGEKGEEEKGEGEWEEGWGGFELVAGRAVCD